MSSFLRASPHLVASESFQVLGGAGLPSSRLSPLRSSASFQLTSNWVLCRLLVCCWFLATKSQGRGCKSRFFTSVLYAPRPSCWWADFRLGKSFEPWLHWGSGCFIAPGLSLWGCGVWRLWQTEIPRSRRPKSFVWKPTRCSWTSTRYVWGKKIIHRTTSD